MSFVLITGGSKGIGLNMIHTFKKNNYKVIACSRRLNEDIKIADLYFSCDISKKEQVSKMFREIEKKDIRIQCLINNAGIAGQDTIEDRTDDLWHNIMATNLHGTYYVTQASLNLLDEGSSIINIASVLGHIGVPDQIAYCTAKHGIIGFTKSLAKKMANHQIRVNAISPGWVQTAMAKQRMSELDSNFEKMSASIPLKRIIDPQEISDMAIYLASDKARNITGQSFIIDGGFL